MQRQPEADPIDDSLFTGPDRSRKPAPQARCAIQVDTARRRDIKAVVGQQMMDSNRVTRRAGLAPLPVEGRHAHLGSPLTTNGKPRD